MKKILVKLNFPVLINTGEPWEKKYLTIYGFLAPCGDDENEYNEDSYAGYVSYLAAMSEWSRPGFDKFGVDRGKNWIDKEGYVHLYDGWCREIADSCKEDIGLGYTLSVIDRPDVRDDCYTCGVDNGLITCKCCLEHFDRIAQMQNKEQGNVCIFNRPIWLPSNVLFVCEDGYSHIYGFLTDRELTDEHLEDCGTYLGYLALCEEVNLAGISPSGYTADLEKDGQIWYGNGQEYSCRSKEIEEEGHLCQKKHNLKLAGATVNISQADFSDGVKNGFIISEELYGDILRQIAEQKTKVDVQN